MIVSVTIGKKEAGASDYIIGLLYGCLILSNKLLLCSSSMSLFSRTHISAYPGIDPIMVAISTYIANAMGDAHHACRIPRRLLPPGELSSYLLLTINRYTCRKQGQCRSWSESRLPSDIGGFHSANPYPHPPALNTYFGLAEAGYVGIRASECRWGITAVSINLNGKFANVTFPDSLRYGIEIAYTDSTPITMSGEYGSGASFVSGKRGNILQ